MQMRGAERHIAHAITGDSSPSIECVQRRPSRSIRFIACCGPHEPGAYSNGLVALDCHACSIGSITVHAASASSPRMNSPWSPTIGVVDQPLVRLGRLLTLNVSA